MESLTQVPALTRKFSVSNSHLKNWSCWCSCRLGQQENLQKLQARKQNTPAQGSTTDNSDQARLKENKLPAPSPQSNISKIKAFEKNGNLALIWTRKRRTLRQDPNLLKLRHQVTSSLVQLASGWAHAHSAQHTSAIVPAQGKVVAQKPGIRFELKAEVLNRPSRSLLNLGCLS
jgi:hypothetical protein